MKPCEGIYVDVKKSPVDIVESAKNQLLIEEYGLNYTSFKDDYSWIYQGNDSQVILGNRKHF